MRPQDKILVLDSDMVPALTVARSLHRCGLSVDIASNTAHPIASYSSAVAATLRYPDPMSEDVAFVDWVAACIVEEKYALIIPVTERTVVPLLRQRGRFDDRTLAMAPSAALEIALDKSKTLELAQGLGIPAPLSISVNHIAELAQASADLRYPVVVKPARSLGTHSKRRVQLSVDYAFNANELHAKTIHALQYGSVLLQEYVGGQGVGVELIADHGKVVYAFQHRRLHEVPLTGGGSSLRISEALNPALLDASAKLMQALAWHGVAMVEFKRDPDSGRFSLMEINGRFWGSLPLALAAGADFPAMLYELMIENAVRSRPPARLGIYGRHLARDLYWAELVLRRAGPASLVHFPSPAQIVKDALLIFSPRHYFDVQQWRDPRPGMVDVWRMLKEQAQRVSRLIGERRLARRLRKQWAKGTVAARVRNAHQILFVCYGNINRSILAERYFRIKTVGMPIACSSAGFHDEDGRPADPAMIKVAERRGIDLSSASSKHINNNLIAEADLIFVMEQQHYQRIATEQPEAAERTFLLDARGEIDDPYGKPPDAYAKCLDAVTQSIDHIAQLVGTTKVK